MPETPRLLNSFERCSRLAYLSERWQPPALRPVELLYESIETGLTSPGDAPWDVAEQKAMALAVERGIDSNQVDLLAEAEHLSSLASFITFVLRPGGAWKRPEAIPLPDGTLWTPSGFLSPTESHLRRLVLCSRWDAYRQIVEEHNWMTLEGDIYGVSMDLWVVVLGSERDGKRHGPLAKGYRHPVSKTLRFKKRDGEDFGSTWGKVWREHDKATREEWLDALVEDGVLPEVIQVHTVVPERVTEIAELAQNKLRRIRETKETPEENPSQCFSRFHPCSFRGCCSRGLSPSPETGFVVITP
jgi:hypothetical protein